MFNMKGKAPLSEKLQPKATMKSTASVFMKETTKEVKPSLPLKKENISKNPSKLVMEEKPSVKLIQQQPVQPVKSVREPPFKQLRNESKLRQPSFMAEVKQDLFPCKQCGRSFVETSLKRHEKICKKIFINKRKEFNSAKQRIVAKEQITLLKKNKNMPETKPNAKKQMMPLWKQQSMAFRLAMKEVRGGKKTEEELQFQQKQKKIVKSSMFNCRFCGRSFNQEAGRRHEPFCQQKAKDMIHQKKRK